MIITETDAGCQLCHLCALGYGGMIPEWLANNLNRGLLNRLLGIQKFLETFPTASDRSEAIEKVAQFNSFYRVSKTSRNSSDPDKCQEHKDIDSVFREWAVRLRAGELKHTTNML